MSGKNAWMLSLTVPVMVVMLMMFSGTRSVVAKDQPVATGVDVKIDNFVFGPQTVTIPVGATVTWTNHDDIPHTSVSTDGVFKSKVMDTDEKFSYTFIKAGTYSYFCSIHPKMTGTVVVK